MGDGPAHQNYDLIGFILQVGYLLRWRQRKAGRTARMRGAEVRKRMDRAWTGLALGATTLSTAYASRSGTPLAAHAAHTLNVHRRSAPAPRQQQRLAPPGGRTRYRSDPRHGQGQLHRRRERDRHLHNLRTRRGLHQRPREPERCIPPGSTPASAGSLKVTGGTGRYKHAHGSGGLYGAINRKTDALTVQTTGKLSY